MRSYARIATLSVLILGTGSGLASATSVPLFNATADFSQANFGIGEAIDGFITNADGWAIFDGATSARTGVFETGVDPTFAGGTLFTFVLSQMFSDAQHNVGRFRLSYTLDSNLLFADGLQTGGDIVANWVVFDPLSAVASNLSTLTELGDNSILASGIPNGNGTYTITASTLATGITGFRLETLLDASLPTSGPGRHPTNGNFVLTEFAVDAVAAQQSTAVPEPGTMGLLLAGLGALRYRYSRRRRA